MCSFFAAIAMSKRKYRQIITISQGACRDGIEDRNQALVEQLGALAQRDLPAHAIVIPPRRPFDTLGLAAVTCGVAGAYRASIEVRAPPTAAASKRSMHIRT